MIRWRWAILSGVGLVLYAGALRAGFVWDDLLTAVPARPLGEVLTRRTGSYYRPLVMLSFALDRTLWGASPAGFHLTNVLLHVAVAGLLASFAAAVGLGAGASTAAALVFLAHPVQTEAVTYVSGRTDVLCALFALLGLLAWRRARRAVDGWAVASAAAFAGALLCKEAAVLLPLVLLLPGAHPAPASSRPPPVLPIAVAASWALALGAGTAPAVRLAELPARVPAIALAALTYARLLVWPSDLHLERFTAVAGVAPRTALAAIAALLGLAAGLVLVARRAPGGLLFLTLALLAWVPLSGVVPVYPAIADRVLFTPEHFLYLPLLGLAPLAAGFVARAWPPCAARALPALVVTLVVVWGAVVADRNRDWSDEETLFGQTIRYDPPTARVWFNLGNLALRDGRLGEAAARYREALAREPRDGAAHLNLAITLDRIEPFTAEAERHYRQAMASDPTLGEAYRGLAAHLVHRGEIEEARRLLAQAGAGR
jgi:tetratricopeptide (TPR) repeat protein